MVEVKGSDLIKASVLASLVLVVGALIIVTVAQERDPVRQCFKVRMDIELTQRLSYIRSQRGNQSLTQNSQVAWRPHAEARSWAYCINGAPLPTSDRPGRPTRPLR